MRSLEQVRKAQAQLAAKAIGQDARMPRWAVGQIQSAGHEYDFSILPVDVSEYAPIQDFTTGTFYFMVGVSSVGGDDPIQGV